MYIELNDISAGSKRGAHGGNRVFNKLMRGRPNEFRRASVIFNFIKWKCLVHAPVRQYFERTCRQRRSQQ